MLTSIGSYCISLILAWFSINLLFCISLDWPINHKLSAQRTQHAHFSPSLFGTQGPSPAQSAWPSSCHRNRPMVTPPQSASQIRATRGATPEPKRKPLQLSCRDLICDGRTPQRQCPARIRASANPPRTLPTQLDLTHARRITSTSATQFHHQLPLHSTAPSDAACSRTRRSFIGTPHPQRAYIICLAATKIAFFSQTDYAS